MTNFENNTNSPHECDRKEDLLAYLYNEASGTERTSFEHHLNDCDSCRNELNAFGRVRDELSAWQVGVAPRTELALQQRKIDVWRDFISLFPAWSRGAALASAAAALLLFALSFAGTRVLVNGNNAAAGQTAMTSEQIEAMVKDAVGKERLQLQEEFRANMAGFKEQLHADYQAQLQAVNRQHQAKLEAVTAGLKAEIRKANRRNSSIRSFFAMDDSQDPWGEVR